MRCHLLALPSAQTTRAYSLCGFTQATIRMARILELLGHQVCLYASEDNDAPCDELVTVITKAEQAAILGEVAYQYAPMFPQMLPLWALANARTVLEIEKRAEPEDLILTIGGTSQQPIAEALPHLMTVEYSIGYVSTFAKYRVYESEAWRSWHLGRAGSEDGRYFDATIPMFFEARDFPFRAQKDPFALFVGRLTHKKGLPIACEAAAAAGIPLKVIGHGDESLITHGAEFLGTLDWEARNEWMARASCLIAPTIYFEPFGNVAVEAQLCGTPVISPDFGGFVETVEQGRTGYRCSYLGEFVQALHDVSRLNPAYIRQRAVAQYSLEAVAPQYQRYFERLALLWGNGWNSRPPVVRDLVEVAYGG